MNCNKVEQLISSYVDNELSSLDSVAVRAHLFACESCQAEENATREIKLLLGRLPVFEPSSEFEQRLMRAVRTQTLAPSKRGSIFAKSAISFGAIAGLSLALLLIAMPLKNSAELGSSGASLNSVKQKESANLVGIQIERDMAYFNSTDAIQGGVVFSPVNLGPR